jgi:hypothetical protein
MASRALTWIKRPGPQKGGSIMKLLGQHVQVEVTPLRRFEDFAADVKKRLE